MPRVYVSVGSNIDRERNIRDALLHLQARYAPLILSPVYENAAVGFDGDPFYNLVAGFNTAEPVEALRDHLHAVEDACGRRRSSERFTARTMDLDLLTYGNAVRHDLAPPLPRPDIVKYAFVLRPLADIAPLEPHPETGVPYGELWHQWIRDSAESLRRLPPLRWV